MRRSSSPPFTATCSEPATWRRPRARAGSGCSSRRIASARGRYPLDDWLVPVVYQQEPFDFSFAKKAENVKPDGRPELPGEARDTENPYGFIGRDGAVLALERAMRRPPAGLLIQGLGCVGKTTLTRGFLQWLQATDGLGKGGFWFTFQDIHSAEFVFNRMGEAFFGPQFVTAEMGQKIDKLADHFKKSRFLIVWDNFEVVRGIPGTPVAATLSGEDQALLKTFLAKLRDGQTKVIITSRSDEEWLETTNRYEIPLGGLQGEERWDYCEVILRDLGLTIDRKDADLVKLMDFLGGHPLAMRVILPRLAKQEGGRADPGPPVEPDGPRTERRPGPGQALRNPPLRRAVAPGRPAAAPGAAGAARAVRRCGLSGDHGEAG